MSVGKQRYGFKNITFSSNTPTNLGASSNVFSVRVTDIILDSSHPKFTLYGGWNSIGTIFFKSISNPGANDEYAVSNAKSIFSNLKLYPLVGEMVTIITIIGQQNTPSTTTPISYYLPPVNFWNSQHHNALPDLTTNQLPPSQQKDYQQVEGGSVRRVTDGSTEIELGSTFQEKTNIYPLLSYEGDYILEGRWGNSIRFGSTVKNPSIKNNWSDEGNEGDPIAIIRNGQRNLSQPGWEPTIEDINGDDSSIYLTSTQKIPLFPASNIKDSFANTDDKLEDPQVYKGNQILLNSGRLVLNAKQDSLILSSNKTIHLSANKEIHLDSSIRTVINTGELYLGSRQANERLVLGDTFVRELQKLVTSLEGLAKACTTAQAGPYPVSSLNFIGSSLEASIKDLKGVLSGPNPKILSKDVKTK